MFRQFTTLIITLGCISIGLHADAQILPNQGQVIPNAAKLSAGEQRFDDVVRQFESLLKNCERFTVNVTSQWESTGASQRASGTNLFRVISQTHGRLLIEAGSKEAGPARFVCVSNGRTVTRLYRPSNYYSQQPVSNLYKELEGDPMTVQMLGESGVDFLIRPDFRAHLVAQIRSLKDLGTETQDGKTVRHFHLVLAENRTLDAWFQQTSQPMLTKLVRTVAIPVDARQTFQLTTTNTFRWEIGDAIPDRTFAVQIPPSAKKVSDLYAALRNGDIGQLVGKMAPDFQLRDLAGQTIQLSQYRGRTPVVLIFWASWCAPSTDAMPDLNDFLRIAKQAGVVVFAINLGEAADQVRQFVAARGYRGTVLLDPKPETVNTFRIGSIPATILIAKDGTVKSYFLGGGAVIRTQIRQATEALVRQQ